MLGGHRAIDVHKTINIDAPIEEVFEFWSHFENFPRFMAHVCDIENVGGGRWRCNVVGPAGVPVQWIATITEFIPNEVLAWKTEAGAVVEHAGIIRFEPNADGGTRLDIRMSYNPVGGAIAMQHAG